MRSYSGRVAYGALVLFFGVAGGLGCSGSTDVIPGPGTTTDAGSDADTGGEGGTDADSNPECPTLNFATPEDGAQLTEQDDVDGDFCANGFQYDVAIATNADDGTIVSLYGNAGKIADATVAAGLARYDNVQLPSMGSETLRAEIEIDGDTCTAQAAVTVACAGAPECEITQPTITATHPELNGVPVADGGDRVSAPGSAYQVAFEVQTNVADGQPVILNVDGNVSAVSSNAIGGVATFPGVTLVPDGDHTVTARCVPVSGIEGMSTTTTYTVDTEAPPLSAHKVKENDAITPLQDGDHWNPEDDADPATDGLQIRVCGTTDAASAPDALDLPASLGTGQQNFCVAVGTSSPTCTPATTGGAATAGDGACVTIDCPGGGPFNLTLTLRDDAGNPTEETIQGVTCASTLPQVQFLDPVGDGPTFDDIDKRILSASMSGQVQRVDKNAAALGAQYDVVVCTTAQSGTAVLSAGLAGATLGQLGTAAVESDGAGVCANVGMSNLARFPDVTLPQSAEDNALDLVTATELRVELEDQSGGEGTASIRIWVDSTPPNLSIVDPVGLCGSSIESSTDYTTDVRFLSAVVPVELTVGTATYVGTQIQTGSVTIEDVVFPLGTSAISARTEEPAGNVGTIPSPCEVTIGQVPSVTWVAPTQGSKLAASTSSGAGIVPDGDAVAAGWQGTLRVCTDIDTSVYPGATVQFSTNTVGDIGTPVPLDGSGCAERPNTDLSEADLLILTAETSPIDGFSGTASISVPVDVTAPGAPTSVSASVLDRRQTSFQVTWTAPADGTKNAAGYDVRVSQTIIDTPSAFDTATSVTYTGAPAAAGTSDGIAVGDRFIETDYFFAVRARDVAGNLGPIAHTTASVAATFNRTMIESSVTNEQFGWWVDGTGDINNDGLSDMLVGAYNGVASYAYFGSVGGIPTTPSVTFAGGTLGFGSPLVAIGDINGDGLGDVAAGAPLDDEGKVYVYYGRTNWPNTLEEANSDVVIRASSSGDPLFASSLFGISIAAIGDYNGDGTADFAIGTPYYGGLRGHLTIVYGQPGGLPAEVTVPADQGTHVTSIVGPAGENSAFGYLAMANAGFYPVPPGTTTLIFSAPLRGTNRGRLYSFAGIGPQASPLSATQASHVFDGEPGEYIGLASLLPLRNVPGISRPALVAGLPAEGNGQVVALSGTETVGPFANVTARITDATATEEFDFGNLVVSSSFTSSTGSFIGSDAADVVLSAKGKNGALSRVHIVDGSTLVGQTVPSDIVTYQPVTVDMPADWVDFATFSTALRDLNGDGYADIAVPEFGTGAFDGRVLVLW